MKMAPLTEAAVRLGLENLKKIVDEMSLGAVQLLDYFEAVYIETEG